MGLWVKGPRVISMVQGSFTRCRLVSFLSWEVCKIVFLAGVVVCSLAGSLSLISAVEFGQGTGFIAAVVCLMVAFLSGTATGVVGGEKIRTSVTRRFSDIRFEVEKDTSGN